MSLLLSPSRYLTARVLSTSARLARQDLGGNEGIQPYGTNIPAGFAKIKERQRIFNIDNGQRVHERGGRSDYMWHTITLAVVIVGFMEWCRVIYVLAYPKK